MWQARSPLAERPQPVASSMAGGDPGVHLTERRGLKLLALAAAATDADGLARAAAVFGAPLPPFGHATVLPDVTVLGHLPDCWLALSATPHPLSLLREAVPEAVIRLDGAFTVLGLAGPGVVDLLAKGLPLDLSDPRHAPGRTFTSRIGKLTVTLYRTDVDGFELFVARSFAAFFLDWLRDAANGIGLAFEDE